jgi:hypothetical protein
VEIRNYLWKNSKEAELDWGLAMFDQEGEQVFDLDEPWLLIGSHYSLPANWCRMKVAVALWISRLKDLPYLLLGV